MEAEAGKVRGQEWLLCRAGSALLGLPLSQIAEVMRPLPIERISGAPAFVRGVCVVRGAPVAVIHGGQLVTGADTPVERLVTLRIGERTVAFGVEQIIGVRTFDSVELSAWPPLLQNAAADAVDALHTLDGELLMLLKTSCLVPDGLLGERSAEEAASP